MYLLYLLMLICFSSFLIKVRKSLTYDKANVTHNLKWSSRITHAIFEDVKGLFFLKKSCLQVYIELNEKYELAI